MFFWSFIAAVLLLALPQGLAWTMGDATLASTPEQSRELRGHRLKKHRVHPPTVMSEISSRKVISTDGEVLPPYNTIYFFDQLIDHSNPSLGTFKQRYWHTWEFYQPGGPIFITTPGEGNAELEEGFSLTNATLQGAFAQTNAGATIVLEHRFFGQSNPFPQMNVQTLAVHNVAQAIEDLAYFAQNVILPMPGGNTDAIRPHKVPWVLSGGSYSGALTSWTLNKKPGVFWAGYSSSGVIQPIADFWQYFEPIRLNMPKNCSADVQRVVQFVDNVVASGNGTAILELAGYFGLANAGSVEAFLKLSENEISSTRKSLFYQFCDTLEISGSYVATAAGWGLENALLGWATFMKQSSILGEWTYDSKNPAPDDPDSRHTDISWMWMICNEFGWVQRGSSDLTQLAISFRQYTLQDFEYDCRQMFPGAFMSNDLISRVAATSDTYLGWKTTADRLFVANGYRDPWLYATHSAPTQNLQSTDLRPIRVSDGFHCTDLSVMEGGYSESVYAIQKEAMQTMNKWIASFTPRAGPVDTTPVVGHPSKNGARRLFKAGVCWRSAFISLALGWLLP
ncbi:hypothetical protein M413DRAFT_440323 [Hebeloma cylindrosporum]|uniref:Peptidase S28 n=1 Tax=Hebeloma cylindrosporum TaxID=76867 RepID=A0A0C3CRQ1_HEBCY|nr:hypothetical protein M413DRAFT_440323 [Hebeloma cylindrosporum h7]